MFRKKLFAPLITTTRRRREALNVPKQRLENALNEFYPKPKLHDNKSNQTPHDSSPEIKPLKKNKRKQKKQQRHKRKEQQQRGQHCHQSSRDKLNE